MLSKTISNIVNQPGRLAHLALVPLLLGAATAQALVITPEFDSSISGNSNANQIEGAINSAIQTIDGLYDNSVTLAVDFTYDSAGSGQLLSTSQSMDSVSYSHYVRALTSDSTANPTNTTLATAVANLPYGNDANGSKYVALSTGLAEMLGLLQSIPSAYTPTININSSQNFGLSQPVSSSQYDLVGGLEHELNEVLGGGGGGSTLNSVYSNTAGLSTEIGPLDLYRYSAAQTPSFTTSSSASSYLSVDGGITKLVSFNQNNSGDYGDFTPSCGAGVGGGLSIQNAFNCTGAYEAYTTNTTEFKMMQSLGWDSSSTAVPLPAAVWSFMAGLMGLLALGKKRKK